MNDVIWPPQDGAHPNQKLYELRFRDGSCYVLRSGGRPPETQWDLSTAIAIANFFAARTGDPLMVTDPETGTVLWDGQAMR